MCKPMHMLTMVENTRLSYHAGHLVRAAFNSAFTSFSRTLWSAFVFIYMLYICMYVCIHAYFYDVYGWHVWYAHLGARVHYVYSVHVVLMHSAHTQIHATHICTHKQSTVNIILMLSAHNSYDPRLYYHTYTLTDAGVPPSMRPPDVFAYPMSASQTPQVKQASHHMHHLLVSRLEPMRVYMHVCRACASLSQPLGLFQLCIEAIMVFSNVVCEGSGVLSSCLDRIELHVKRAHMQTRTYSHLPFWISCSEGVQVI